jgi:spore germination protein KB
MQEMKISVGQAIFLIIGTIFPTAMLTLPTGVVKYASTDAWISLLLGVVIGIMTALVSSSVAMKHPDLTFFQIIEMHLGRFWCKAIGLLFTLYFFVTSIDVVRQFTDFIIQSVLKKTPPVVLGIVIVLTALYAIYHGIEVIARVNTIVITGSFLVFAISSIFYFHEMKLNNLLPVFVAPLGKILMGSYTSSSWFTEVFAIMLLASFMNKPDKARNVALVGIVLTGLSMTWVVVGSIAIFGVRIIPLFEYPTFNVFRIIEVARFLERTDAFFIAVWVGLMFMKVAIVMFFSFYCFCQTFGIGAHKPFLVPFGMLTLTLSLTSWGSKLEYNRFLRDSGSFYLLISLVIPVILWILVRWKNSTGKVTT